METENNANKEIESTRTIIIIAAMTKEKHVIGKDNWLPWEIPEELAHFRNTTMGATVIMGRRTYDSVGRPMPKRHNIVVTRQADLEIAGVDICNTIEEALIIANHDDKEIFIIGGAGIYKVGIPYSNKMYLSFIKEEYEGDTTFPEWDESEWEVESSEDKGEWIYIIYKRIKGGIK
ncbi:MAG: dihydrofolate reductase [Candidatus Woesearchaeota archaeon]